MVKAKRDLDKPKWLNGPIFGVIGTMFLHVQLGKMEMVLLELPQFSLILYVSKHVQIYCLEIGQSLNNEANRRLFINRWGNRKQ
jgi:hypothetical protein